MTHCLLISNSNCLCHSVCPPLRYAVLHNGNHKEQEKTSLHTNTHSSESCLWPTTAPQSRLRRPQLSQCQRGISADRAQPSRIPAEPRRDFREQSGTLLLVLKLRQNFTWGLLSTASSPLQLVPQCLQAHRDWAGRLWRTSSWQRSASENFPSRCD